MVAWHNKIVVNHIALNTICSKTGTVGNLRIIFVKILGEIDNRLLYKLKVAVAANHYTQSDGVAFFV